MTVNIEDRIRDAIDAWGADVTASPEAWTAIHHRVNSPKRTGRLRRLGIWGASLGLIAAVGIPVEQALVAASDHGTRVAVVRPPSPNPPTPSDANPSVVDAPGTGASADAGGAAGAASASGDTPASANPGIPPQAGPGTGTPDDGSSGPPSYPLAQSCSVDDNGLPPPASSQTHTCRFTATTSGGWSYYQNQSTPEATVGSSPVVRVIVTRGTTSQTYTYDANGPPCFGTCAGPNRSGSCATDIIRPGDLVEVDMTVRGQYQAPAKAGAGYLWDCLHDGS